MVRSDIIRGHLDSDYFTVNFRKDRYGYEIFRK